MRPRRALPQQVVAVAAVQEGLVNKKQCDAAGLDKHAVALLVRHGRWRRVTRCVYDTDPEPIEVRQRDDYHGHLRRRAAWVGMLAVPDGIATGACALVLHGLDGLVSDVVPEAARPGGMHAQVNGVVLRRYRNFDDQPYRGRRIAAVEPALAQALPYLSREEAVAVLSGALRDEHIDAAGLRTVRGMLRGRRGAERVTSAFDLADARDGSVAETLARLSFLDCDVPPDGQQVTFTAAGVFLARVDFAWLLPDGRYVVVEIDGRAFHSGRAMLADDAERQNRLVATGRLIVLRFPAARLLGGEAQSVGIELAGRLKILGWRPSPRLPGEIALAPPATPRRTNVGLVAPRGRIQRLPLRSPDPATSPTSEGFATGRSGLPAGGAAAAG